MVPVATFTTQVLLLSTGGGLLTNGLRALFGSEEALCPLDGELPDGMPFGFAHMADPLVDEDPPLETSDELLAQPAPPALGSIALAIQIWWELHAPLRERLGLQSFEEPVLFAGACAAFGALVVAALVWIAHRWLWHATRFRFAIDGMRCELLDRSRFATAHDLTFKPVWRLPAWPSRGGAISRAEKTLQTALLHSACGTAYLIVNA